LEGDYKDDDFMDFLLWILMDFPVFFLSLAAAVGSRFEKVLRRL